MKAQIALMLGTRQLEGAGIRGAATDARWHLGSLMPFVAWMVLLPDT